MPIFAASLLKGAALPPRSISYRKPSAFMSARWSLTRILHSLGRGFLVPTRSFTSQAPTKLLLGAMRLKAHWRMHRTLQPNSSETLLALGYYQYRVMRDYGAAKTTFKELSKMLPGSSEVRTALGRVTRREGRWDESIAFYEQALAMDPRNVELLTDAAETYGMVRQFPAARKLYDRALDIMPDDRLCGEKAAVYRRNTAKDRESGGKGKRDVRARPLGVRSPS